MIASRLRTAPVSNSPHLRFFLCWLFSFAVWGVPFGRLGSLALHDERYSYIPVIPLVSLWLIYLERRRIFQDSRPCRRWGIPFLAAGAAGYGILRVYAAPGGEYSLSLAMILIVSIWMSAFLLYYGVRAFREAIFPLTWLFLMVPIPSVGLDRIVLFLQQGSAEMTYLLFQFTGIPVLRQAFTFSLPGVDIEIAAQCSGIRSSLTFMIAGILAGRFFLRSFGSKLCLSLLTVPIVIFKNALRIYTITWLGIHVDPGFLRGDLHRYSGLPFSLVALALLVPVLILLQKAEAERRSAASKLPA